MLPPWYIFYTERLKTVFRTCPSTTFFKVHPTYDNTVRCTVLKKDTYQRSVLPSQCVLSANIVNRLYEAIHTGQTSVLFENNTRVLIDVVSASALVSLLLRIDPNHPPTQSYTHFTDQATCRSMKAFVETMQQQQYTHTTASFVTNPRFAKLELDQWYPNMPNYPRMMCYDQLHYTAGDWSDLWYHAMYSSYTKMQNPLASPPRTLRPKVKQVMQHIKERFLDKNTPYIQLSPSTTLNTLRYMFQKQQKGIFVRIKDNSLDTFLPFIRHNFTNDYYHQLHLPESFEAVRKHLHIRTPEDRKRLEKKHRDDLQRDREGLQRLHECETKLRNWDTMLDCTDPHEVSTQIQHEYKHTLEELLKAEYECAKRYATYFPPNRHRPDDILKKNPNRRQWLANNHFFNCTTYYDSANVNHFHHLLQQLVQHREHLPDIEFVLMLRDSPVLRTSRTKDGVSIHQPFPNVEKTDNAVQMRCTGGLAPILSHTGKDGYYDIPLPTVDDIEHFEQRYFLMQCNGTKPQWTQWKDKTIGKAVFRGSATGKGTTAETNMRLIVRRIARETTYAHLFDVHLVALNTKVKTDADQDGLVMLDVDGIQQQLTTGKKQHRIDSEERAKYKYNLVLDGHTRADRLGNEMCTGSLVILPTTDGHRLWIEPFLHPLDWTDIKAHGSAFTAKYIQQHKYTHVTIHNLNDLGKLVQWLADHDTIAESIVDNAHRWLFTDGYYSRLTPATNFLYDYMEGVVRALAKQHCYTSTSKPYTLVPASTLPKTSAKIVGIVVGFRDSNSNGNGVRSQQLAAFCAYFDKLFPSAWKRVIVVAEQAVVANDRKTFDVWWKSTRCNTSATDETTVYDYIMHLQTGLCTNTLPECLRRNLLLVNNDCALACGVGAERLGGSKLLRWSKDECYRRTAEQKFNLGLLKNAGYAYLRATHKTRLSHVVFTDIDMLPDHELAPYYVRTPRANELIALATRGTAYDHFVIGDMPHYVLVSKSQLHHRPTRNDTRHRYGGRRKHTLHNKHHKHHKHTQHPHRRNTHLLNHTKKHQSSFRPTTAVGRPCVSSWMSGKFRRFLGASVSISPQLFEATNGYPNNYWGWGGEDDEFGDRLKHVEADKSVKKVAYTVPHQGRLIDLEMAQPVTVQDKLANRVKEMQKKEKRGESLATWQDNGLRQVTEVCKMRVRKGGASVVRVVVDV